MPNDLRITWGSPSPDRGEQSATFLTVTVSDPEQLDTVFDDSLPELPEEPEPTSEGAIELTDAPPPVVADRYERRHPLGSGGMGEVWRVFDRTLRRTVALKVIRSQLTAKELLARFEEEAQVTAQLQHPGIIPVHDYGQLDDGRVWFTMKEVQGRTLEDLLQEVHRAWRLGRDATESGFTFRRMLESFLRVVETMAYSHSRGVVHRDLKPSNIMIGAYGEVLVLDWGLAKLVGATEQVPADEAPVDLGPDQNRQTKVGAITGTPAYMSPEQAQGDSYDAGPGSDVYSLGATLYDLLCERPPRMAQTPKKLVLQVAMGTRFPSPRDVSDGPPFDEELERICLKSLEQEAADRYPDAGAMALDLAKWLDDAQKRERAMAFVEASWAKLRVSDQAAAQAEAKRGEAVGALEDVPKFAEASEQLKGWALEDEAIELEEQARTARTEAVQGLRAALSHAPDFRTAHDMLADHFHKVHQELEQSEQAAQARQVAKELALHDQSGRYAAYLKGTGALTLITDPDGVEVRLHQYVLEDRRLKARFLRSLGHTPLVEVPLEMGSYLLTLHKQGHEVVRYPVFIQRQEHWHGVPPDGSDPYVIRVPGREELAKDDCYVPAGWCLVGDPAEGLERVWIEGMVVKRTPVTVRQYAGFLNGLIDQGREEEAVRLQPKLADTTEPTLTRDAQGRFGQLLVQEGQADWWEDFAKDLDLPIVFVDRDEARAYCEHLGTGWRLPVSHEYQKMARGVDGRTYPWGETFYPTWCRMRDSGPVIHFTSVGSYPTDTSPYRCVDVLANVSEWSSEGYLGGSCGNTRGACALWRSLDADGAWRTGYLGFRAYRPFQ